MAASLISGLKKTAKAATAAVSNLIPDKGAAPVQGNGEKSTPSPAAGDPQPPTSEEKKPNPVPENLSAIFNVLYIAIAIGILVVLWIIAILSVMDVSKYVILHTVQVVTQTINPNMFNADTIDMSMLMYAKNNTDTEPYKIYLQQKMVSVLFYMVFAFIMIFGAQLIIIVIMAIVAKSKGRDDVEVPDVFSIKFELIVIILGLIAAYILNAYYNARFLNALQPELIGANESIQSIKNFIYDNITTNSAFLTNLTAGNLKACTDIINQQTSISTISRMVFAISLYNFYKINISENEEEFNRVIQKIFTPREIELREINPIDYMYYNQNVFLPNLYPLVRKSIYGADKAINSSARDKAVRDDVGYRINEANKRLMYLFKIPTKRDSVRTYMIINMVIVLAIVGGITVVYWGRLKGFFEVIGGLFKRSEGKAEDTKEPAQGKPVQELAQGKGAEGAQASAPKGQGTPTGQGTPIGQGTPTGPGKAPPPRQTLTPWVTGQNNPYPTVKPAAWSSAAPPKIK